MLRLRELRIEKGKTQAEIASAMQISRQVYANYENEINEPSLQMLRMLADYFGVQIDYLLGRSDDFGNITIKEKSSPSLTTEEQQLLNDFRSLPKPEQAQATEYVRFLSERRGAKKNQA